jgi:hypothetical protein
MVITPYFVFIHVRKTGGITIETVCKRHFRVIHSTPERHEPYSDVPPEYAHLPAISFVRNPWDWYVSHWAWMVKFGKRSPMAQAAREGFDPFMRAYYRQAKKGHGYTEIIETVTKGTEVEKFEGLAGNFVAFLERHQIPFPDQVRDDLETLRINAADRGSYRDYYDSTTRAMVAETSAPIIERFGYEF